MDLRQITLETANQLKPFLNQATLYVDAHFSEILNWSWPGGISSLFESGVWNIKDLDAELEFGDR